MMAIANLPPSFQDLPLSEAERTAVMRFISDAPKVAPGVIVVKPRRSSSGRLKVVVELPEGNLWDLFGELAGLSHRIEDETGVLLLMD